MFGLVGEFVIIIGCNLYLNISRTLKGPEVVLLRAVGLQYTKRISKYKEITFHFSTFTKRTLKIKFGMPLGPSLLAKKAS
jgi:hypothetical protein